MFKGYSLLDWLVLFTYIVAIYSLISGIIKKEFSKKESVFWSLALLLLTMGNFFIMPIFVSGPSMNPTYHDRQIVFMNRLDKNINRLDVVVFNKKNSGEKLIKRVYGLPGDKVEIKQGVVFINDKVFDDSSVQKNNLFVDFGPYFVPADCYFVLGDNRPNSCDSRNPSVGFVEKSSIKGVIIKNTK